MCFIHMHVRNHLLASDSLLLPSLLRPYFYFSLRWLAPSRWAPPYGLGSAQGFTLLKGSFALAPSPYCLLYGVQALGSARHLETIK